MTYLFKPDTEVWAPPSSSAANHLSPAQPKRWKFISALRVFKPIIFGGWACTFNLHWLWPLAAWVTALYGLGIREKTQPIMPLGMTRKYMCYKWQAEQSYNHLKVVVTIVSMAWSFQSTLTSYQLSPTFKLQCPQLPHSQTLHDRSCHVSASSRYRCAW